MLVLPQGVLRKNLETILGIIISFSAIIGYLIKVSVSYSRQKARITEQERITKEHESAIEDLKKELKDFYNFKLDTKEILSKLTTTIQMMGENINNQFENIKETLAEIKGGEK